MGARLRIFLTPEEDRILFELRAAQGVPQRTKDRAAVLRLNAHGWKVEKIASHFNWAKDTVRETIHRWNSKGLAGLWDTPRPGRKRHWQPADIIYIEQCLEQEPRTYNSKQLAEKLRDERQVNLSPDRIRRVLKKKGIIWKRTRQSTKDKQNIQQRKIKQADLDMLQLAAATGDIVIKYLDESGFCLWGSVSYSYIKRGQRKRLEQTSRRGRRLSIFGLWQPGVSFDYGLVLGGFRSDDYIKLMDWEAQKSANNLARTGRITVIVQDNGSAHTSKIALAKQSEWESQGLYLLFLPKYCSEMNQIEHEWQQLKTIELGGQMFEDEYDLACAVMSAVQSRGERGQYSTSRFKFNSS